MLDLTPADIVATLSQIGREIDETTQELEEADAAAVHAKGAYEIAHAKAFISSEGAVEIRKARAKIECYELWLAAEVAEQRLRGVTSRLRALRDRLEIGRSLGPLVRLEWGQG